MTGADTKNVFDMSLPATREDLKQLANLQMEFKKELDMMKEGHMDLAKRIYTAEKTIALLDQVDRLREKNRLLEQQIRGMQVGSGGEQGA